MKLTQGTMDDVLALPFETRGKCGHIPGHLTPAQISNALAPVKPSLNPTEKSQYEWIVMTPLGVFTVHDYKGNRWSVGGVVAAARAVLGDALTEGRGPAPFHFSGGP